jgi:hypothetical protein
MSVFRTASNQKISTPSMLRPAQLVISPQLAKDHLVAFPVIFDRVTRMVAPEAIADNLSTSRLRFCEILGNLKDGLYLTAHMIAGVQRGIEKFQASEFVFPGLKRTGVDWRIMPKDV